ncbi:MAG: hypothetical protein HC853_14330 [Anaerolineae bacterium]|nr:hypothetical protein [Anaerolineae bacterium]
MTILRGAYALLLTLFQIVTTGARVFALDSLRSGVVNLRPLSAAVRALVWAALLMVIAFLLSLLFSDALRESGGLQPLRIASSTSRALLAPGLATPITLVAVLLAWSYILTGALHMRPLARWLAFVLFLIFGVQGLTSGLATAPALAVSLGLLAYAPFVGVGCALVLLLLCFIVLPLLKTPLPPAVEFCTVLMLNALLFVPSIAQAAAARSAFGSPFTIDDHAYQAVFVARTALLPFVFIAGVEMANFAQSVGSWVAQAAQRHGARAVLIGLLLILLLYRFAAFVQAKVASGISGGDARAWLGAAVLLLGVGLIALWRLRQPARAEAVPFRWLVGFVLAYMSGNILLLGALPLAVVGLVAYMGVTGEMLAANNVMTGAIVSFSNTFSRYATLLVSALAVLASFEVLRGRGAPSAQILLPGVGPGMRPGAG